MDLPQRSTVRRARSYILEAAAGVAFCYFVLGGSAWTSTAWALFCVVAVTIVVVQVLYDTGRHSDLDDRLWKTRLGFVMVASLLAGAIWQQSLWLLGLGIVLGLFWLSDWHAYRKLALRRSKTDGE